MRSLRFCGQKAGKETDFEQRDCSRSGQPLFVILNSEFPCRLSFGEKKKLPPLRIVVSSPGGRGGQGRLCGFPMLQETLREAGPELEPPESGWVGKEREGSLLLPSWRRLRIHNSRHQTLTLFLQIFLDRIHFPGLDFLGQGPWSSERLEDEGSSLGRFRWSCCCRYPNKTSTLPMAWADRPWDPFCFDWAGQHWILGVKWRQCDCWNLCIFLECWATWLLWDRLLRCATWHITEALAGGTSRKDLQLAHPTRLWPSSPSIRGQWDPVKDSRCIGL